MKRRPFIATLGAAALNAGLGVRIAPAPPRSEFKAWTWVHGNNDPPELWRARFARWRAAGISGVNVGGGDTALLAELAHAEGLTFQAWTWIMNHSGDAWVKANHPEWFNVRDRKSVV